MISIGAKKKQQMLLLILNADLLITEVLGLDEVRFLVFFIFLWFNYPRKCAWGNLATQMHTFSFHWVSSSDWLNNLIHKIAFTVHYNFIWSEAYLAVPKIFQIYYQNAPNNVLHWIWMEATQSICKWVSS